MKSISRIVLCLFALIVVAGCASTNVTQQTPMSNPGLARPNRIWVYNFVANPADMPANSSIGGQVGAPEHATDGRSKSRRAVSSARLSRGSGCGYQRDGTFRRAGGAGIVAASGRWRHSRLPRLGAEGVAPFSVS